jgi:hypothetical protein
MEKLHEVLTDNNFDDFEIITSLSDNDDLPPAWKKIISATGIEEKRSSLINYWHPVSDKLPLTLTLIKKFLEEAAVIKDNGEYRMVYVFNMGDFLSVYIGGLPADSGPFIKHIPDDIAAFYSQIHNGWYEKISGGLGFLALEQMDWLSSNEWGILEDIPTPTFDLNNVFYVFHNAGPGYLCIDVTEQNNPKYLIFWTNKPPKERVEFWPVMDAWIEIGLTN